MPELLAKLAQFGRNGVKAVAAGKTQAELGLQSPELPTAMVRLGRAGYVSSAVWIILSWYTGYCNERTKEGEWKFVLPGSNAKVINPPDRPNKAPFGHGGSEGKRKGGIEGAAEGGLEGLEDANPFGLALKIAKAAGVGDSESEQTRSLQAVAPAQVGSMNI